MAAQKFIGDARSRLESALIEQLSIIETVKAAIPEDVDFPPWLRVFDDHATRIDLAAHAYMDAVHEHAMPVLSDMASLTKR